jgi:hypothetical protein
MIVRIGLVLRYPGTVEGEILTGKEVLCAGGIVPVGYDEQPGGRGSIGIDDSQLPRAVELLRAAGFEFIRDS